MKTLIIWFACSVLLASSGIEQTPQESVARTGETRIVEPEVGYFFSLKQVPLSKKSYVFFADHLKKAVFVDGDKDIMLSHTMTVKNTRGLDMYFSASNYNVTLAVREARQTNGQITTYKGTLFVRQGREKRKFAVHGFQNR